MTFTWQVPAVEENTLYAIEILRSFLMPLFAMKRYPGGKWHNWKRNFEQSPKNISNNQEGNCQSLQLVLSDLAFFIEFVALS